ncbi:glycine betaine ABC transporter substrate-binding protein [Nocardia sp. NPDC048505]|uniref:glycine betaine ABC transporter substrate-binding protein n=1 Tax=unclassified Nocardia TaxID=2637762 RepID=UPI0033E6C853
MLAVSRRMLARVLVVAVSALAVSCGDESAAGPDFVVGAGNSVESNLLAHIYSGALARTGLRVEVRERLGDRPDYLAALDEGAVSLVGEHSGELLTYLDGGSPARTPKAVTEALAGSLPEGLVVADAADGTDMRPRVLLPTVVAEQEGVRTVAALGPRCATTPVGVAPVPAVLRAPEWPVRIAGCDVPSVEALLGPAALREALLGDRIRAGVLGGPVELAPDALAGLTALTDEEYALRAQNVLPVLRKGSLDEVRLKKLNYVAGELTTAELSEMLLRVGAGRISAAEAARDWLDQHAL